MDGWPQIDSGSMPLERLGESNRHARTPPISQDALRVCRAEEGHTRPPTVCSPGGQSSSGSGETLLALHDRPEPQPLASHVALGLTAATGAKSSVVRCHIPMRRRSWLLRVNPQDCGLE